MVKIQTFKDIVVWQRAHTLVLQTYKVTASFPPDERYSLVSQMRRAAISVPSNVVEGFRRRYIKESIRFYVIADASLEELKYQIYLSHELGFISDDVHKCISRQADEVGRLLSGWTQSQKRYAKEITNIHT